jgi:hypothetical protein
MRIPVLFVLLVACSPAQRSWRQAKKLDTSEAYRVFVRAEPTHPKRADALVRIEELDWQYAQTRGSSEAWGNYVAYHPGSLRVNEARTQLEDARWKEALERNDRQGFDFYVLSHPDGRHIDEAKSRLDDVAWKEADSKGTIESYGQYLVRYKAGAHAEEASKKREELIWQQAVAADGPLEYRAYVERFPQGAHLGEAKQAIEGFKFSGVAIRLVVRRTERADSLKTWKAAVMDTLGKELVSQRFKVTWLDPVDARGKPELDALEDVLVVAPEDHAVMVVDLEETRGRDFLPAGSATDVAATVSLVPPGRTRPMATTTVKATTGPKVQVANETGLHLDAQRQFGAALSAAKLPLREWQR